MARPRQPWQSRLENDWTLGIIRDAARVGIPPGGVYDAVDILLHRPGVAFKRGGTVQDSFPGGGTDGLVAVAYANFPGVGTQRVTVDASNFFVDDLTDIAANPHGQITGFTSLIDPPTLFVGGSQNILVFCDSSGTQVPWFYNGGDDVQRFQGGNAGATGVYELAITGTPTGGSFCLAAQDTASGVQYITAPVAFNGSSADVETALTTASSAAFTCTGGALPGTPVDITVPAGWAVSYVPPAQSGFSLTGGTDPAGTIGPVDGTSAGVPNATHSWTHLQRLLLANSAVYPNRIWFGPLLNPAGAAWDTAESWIDMDAAVSGGVSLSNVNLVFSYDSMWRITGDVPPPDSNMTIEPIGHVGCTDARSIVTIEGRCIFANPRGVYVTTGVGYQNLMADRIETYWQSLFTGYDPLTWTISAGLYGRRWLFVTILDNAGLIVKVFLCDLDRRAWVTLSGPRAKMYAAAFGSEEELWAATLDFQYLQKCSGVFTPSIDNAFDAIGSFGCMLETRPVPYSPALKAFGDAHLSYHLHSSVSPVLSKVMKADSTAGDSYARFDLSGDEPDVWLTFRLAVSSASLAFFDTNSSGALVSLKASPGGNNAQVKLLSNPPAVWDLLPGGGGALATSPSANTWMLIEIHYDSGGGTFDFYRDSVLLGTHAANSDVGRLYVGQFDAVTDPDSVFYYDDVKLGTTRGGTDLFADDFESGDFSAWTSTTGDVTVVNDPF